MVDMFFLWGIITFIENEKKCFQLNDKKIDLKQYHKYFYCHSVVENLLKHEKNR